MSGVLQSNNLSKGALVHGSSSCYASSWRYIEAWTHTKLDKICISDWISPSLRSRTSGWECVSHPDNKFETIIRGPRTWMKQKLRIDFAAPIQVQVPSWSREEGTWSEHFYWEGHIMLGPIHRWESRRQTQIEVVKHAREWEKGGWHSIILIKVAEIEIMDVGGGGQVG